MQSDSPPRSSGESKKWRRKGRSGGEKVPSVHLHPVAVGGVLDHHEASPVSYHSSFGGCSAGTVEELQGGDIGETVASPVKRGSSEAVGEPSQVSLKKIKIVTNPLEVCDGLEVGVENERIDLLDRDEGIYSIGGGGWPLTAARSP
ncbi:hypothetical protein ACFX13_042913 [Malus domestica]